MQYNDMSASMAFLKATLAAQDISEGLKQNHGAVRDFMTELLGGVRHMCHVFTDNNLDQDRMQDTNGSASAR